MNADFKFLISGSFDKDSFYRGFPYKVSCLSFLFALIFISSMANAATLEDGVPFDSSVNVNMYSSIELSVPDGATKLIITLTNGSGNLDLYLKYAEPISGSTVAELDAQTDHLSNGTTAVESIVITSASNPPLKSGSWYVSVLNYNASNTSFTLMADIEVEAAATFTSEPISEPIAEPVTISLSEPEKSHSVLDTDDANYLFNWVENEIPTIFPDKQSTDLETEDWYVHYYQSTGHALGLKKEEKDVYVYNGASGELINAAPLDKLVDVVTACGRAGKYITSIGNTVIAASSQVNTDNYNKAVENYTYSYEKMMQNVHAVLRSISADYTKKVTKDSMTEDEIDQYNDRLISTIPCMAETMLYNRDVVLLQKALTPPTSRSEKRFVGWILAGVAVGGALIINEAVKYIEKQQKTGTTAIDNAAEGSNTLAEYGSIVGANPGASKAEVKQAYGELGISDRQIALRNIRGVLTNLSGSSTDESIEAADLMEDHRQVVAESFNDMGTVAVKGTVSALGAATGSATSKLAEIMGASVNQANLIDLVMTVESLQPLDLLTASLTAQGSSKKTEQATISAPSQQLTQQETLDQLNELSKGNLEDAEFEAFAAASFTVIQEILGQTTASSTINADGSMTATVPEKTFIINIKDVKNGDRIKVIAYDDADLLISMVSFFPEFFENVTLSNGHVINLELNPVLAEELEISDNGTEICGDGIDNDNNDQIDEGCRYDLEIYIEDNQCEDDIIGLILDGKNLGNTPMGKGRHYNISDISAGQHKVELVGVESGGSPYGCNSSGGISYLIEIEGYLSESGVFQVGTTLEYSFETE